MSGVQDVSSGSIGYLLWQVALRWRVAADRELAPLGLTHAKYTVLASLYGLHRAGIQPSQRELGDHTGLEPMYVSKLVRSLDRTGLVRRTTHPKDPRAVRLMLTPQGSARVVQGIAAIRKLQEHLLEPLGGPMSPQTGALRASLQALLRGTPLSAGDAGPHPHEGT